MSICNINPFVTDTANNFLDEFKSDPLAFDISKYFVNTTKEELDSLRPTNESLIDISWLTYITSHPKFNDTIRRSFSYWPDYLFDCFIRYAPCDRFQVFEHFYHAIYGNCFRFNGVVKDEKGESRPSQKVGREGDGIGLSMFIGPSDFFYDYLVTLSEIGIIVFINERDVFPYTNQPGLFIKPGTSASIQVRL